MARTKTKTPAPTLAPSLNPVAPPQGYETVRAAAGRLGIPVQKLRNAVSNRREFKTPGAVIRLPVVDSDLSLMYLQPGAVDAYRINNERGADRGAARLRGGKRRWIIRVAPEDEGAIRAALAAFGVELEIASAPKKPKAEAPELAELPRPEIEPGAFSPEEIAAIEAIPDHT